MTARKKSIILIFEHHSGDRTITYPSIKSSMAKWEQWSFQFSCYLICTTHKHTHNFTSTANPFRWSATWMSTRTNKNHKIFPFFLWIFGCIMFSYCFDSATKLFIPKCVAIAIENSYYLLNICICLFVFACGRCWSRFIIFTNSWFVPLAKTTTNKQFYPNRNVFDAYVDAIFVFHCITSYQKQPWTYPTHKLHGIGHTHILKKCSVSSFPFI